MSKENSDQNGGSTRKLARGNGDHEKNFNQDGTSNRAYNRDGTPRSIGKENSIRFKEQERGTSSTKSKQPVISNLDIDSIIKSMSSKELVCVDEIDDFIVKIEETLSTTPDRKTVKNSSRGSLLDGTNAFDRYGFLITQLSAEAFVLPSTEVQKMHDKEDERTDKWIYMINHWDTFFLGHFSKVKSRVRKGIPHAIRGEAWYRLAHVDDMKTLFPQALDLNNLEERLDPQVSVHMCNDYLTVTLMCVLCNGYLSRVCVCV
jgi:hypothetical protein